MMVGKVAKTIQLWVRQAVSVEPAKITAIDQPQALHAQRKARLAAPFLAELPFRRQRPIRIAMTATWTPIAATQTQRYQLASAAISPVAMAQQTMVAAVKISPPD